MLRAQSVAAVSSQPPLGVNQPNVMELTTIASASFQDSLTILPQDSALLGQAGTYTASFLVEGQLDAGGVNANPGSFRLGYADWRMEIVSGSKYFGAIGSLVTGFYGYERFYSGGLPTTGGLGNGGVVRFTAPIVFGIPFTLSGALQTNASAQVTAAAARPLTEGVTTAEGASRYQNTAAWNGIEGVQSGGQSVMAFSVVSESGVNYAAPIPEPGSAILLTGGLSLLAAHRTARGPAPGPHSADARRLGDGAASTKR